MKAKNKKLQYSGRTKAFKRFSEHCWRTGVLIEAGLSGLDENRKPGEELLKKFDALKPPKGPVPANYVPLIKATKEADGKGIKLELDDRTAGFLRKVIGLQVSKHKQLRFHYFSILAVSIWGSFETYISMLFEELYQKRPEMLKTGESLSFNEVITHQNNITGYLVERSLEKLGHLNLNEMLSFLESKINFQFPHSRKKDLESFYLIRNIIAHNCGIVRPDLSRKIPDDISIVSNELRITKPYLKRILSSTRGAVTNLERYVVKKFYK